MQLIFDVFRRDPGPRGGAYRSEHVVELPEHATVLDGLLKIRDEQDPGLSFRASCVRGYCGDCMLRVGGESVLACTAPVAKLGGNGEPIPIDPIRRAPVLKDLVSDQEAFLWSKIKAVKPWLEIAAVASGETLAADAGMAPVRQAMTCHYCGLCNEGCTVLPVDASFLGPAALTKASRFVSDPRAKDVAERLQALEAPGGMWDCVHCFHATENCPRGIEPTQRILAMRDLAYRQGVTNQRVARHRKSFADSVKETGGVQPGTLPGESIGSGGVLGLVKVPSAIRGVLGGSRGRPKRPGAERIKEIFDKAEPKQPKQP